MIFSMTIERKCIWWVKYEKRNYNYNSVKIIILIS